MFKKQDVNFLEYGLGFYLIDQTHSQGGRRSQTTPPQPKGSLLSQKKLKTPSRVAKKSKFSSKRSTFKPNDPLPLKNK